jgi:hypothetical protein
LVALGATFFLATADGVAHLLADGKDDPALEPEGFGGTFFLAVSFRFDSQARCDAATRSRKASSVSNQPRLDS